MLTGEFLTTKLTIHQTYQTYYKDLYLLEYDCSLFVTIMFGSV